MIGAAFEMALAAHAGQRDKSGLAYIGHVARVADGVDTESERVVALLHDVVEDCDVTLDDVAARFGPEIAAAVDAITRRRGEDHADYYDRVKANALAHRVKLADIADNAHPDRMRLLPPETQTRLKQKYETARAALS